VAFMQLEQRATRVHAGARHFLYLPDRSGADAVASTLQRLGWETDVYDDADVCLVVAAPLRVLTGQLAREARAHLEALAAAHGGSYDGMD